MQSTMKFLSSFLIATAVCCSLSGKTIYYYDAINGKDTNDGLTEQTALKTAPATVKADTEYRFMKGTYKANVKLNWLTHNVVITGWKAPREEVVFDGEDSHQCLYSYTSNPDLLGTNLVIRGITFSHAKRTTAGSGGSIISYERDLTISNCVFDTCATSSTSGSNNGGAIYRSARGTLISDCIFTNCAAYQGGAILLYDTSGSAIVTNCEFRNCQAGTGGGGACFAYFGASFEECTFVGNVATNGGAVAVQGETSVRPFSFCKCGFDDNVALKIGGAVHATKKQTNEFVNCTFRRNSAWNLNNAGGAIYNDIVSQGSVSRIQGCTFEGNRVRHWGGAIYGKVSEMSGTTFRGNIAGGTYAGACYLSSVGGETYLVSNCVFEANCATNPTTWVDGGALYLVSSDTAPARWVFQDTDFVSNRVSRNGAAVYASKLQTNEFEHCTFAGNVVDNSAGANAGSGGAYYGEAKAAGCLTFADCAFTENIAKAGGAIYGELTGMDRCTLTGNRAWGADGGALRYVASGDDFFWIGNCAFVSNRVDATSQCWGGAVYGPYNTTTQNGLGFRSCLFLGNVVTNGIGGAIGLNNHNGTGRQYACVENCTFVGNKVLYKASDQAMGGGAIGLYDTKTAAVTATNCVFWGNRSAGSANVQIGRACDLTYFSHCLEEDVSGKRLTDQVNDNVVTGDVTKVFVDFAKGNCMPCRKGALFGAGAYADWMADALDLNGRPRVCADDGSRVDIGCFQFYTPPGLMLILR